MEIGEIRGIKKEKNVRLEMVLATGLSDIEE
jgi:hypothetical protein